MKNSVTKNPEYADWVCEECENENTKDDPECTLCGETKRPEPKIDEDLLSKIDQEWRREFLDYICEDDMKKPISWYEFDDPKSGIVKLIMHLYQIETPIYRETNRGSYM